MDSIAACALASTLTGQLPGLAGERPPAPPGPCGEKPGSCSPDSGGFLPVIILFDGGGRPELEPSGPDFVGGESQGCALSSATP